MALAVTGIDANGRVTPKENTNIVIPNNAAGIGDLIYKSGSTKKVIARGTASATSITISGTTYTLYGCIYGFVAGVAMVVAPNAAEEAKTWGAYPSGAPTWGAGTILMRNGLKTSYYAQMNTAQQASNDSSRGTAGSLVHPTAAYSGGVMTESTFNSSADAKKIYGTWKEYLRQTLRVNGVPGTPFGAKADGVKVHEFGRWMTRNYLASSTYPAGYKCYTYRGAGDTADGNWWLPSMFELAELMIDEHLDKVNENSAVLSVSKGVDRWSCVLYSSSGAWICDDYGISANYVGFTVSLTVRPVTLVKLTD